MLVFHRDQIAEVIRLDENLVKSIEQAFASLATKKIELPPIMRIDIPEHNGEVDIKSAYVQGEDSFAVKISSGFFNNPEIGLPSSGGMMVLLSAKTGTPQAVLSDHGLLTDLRTAAAGAVSAKYGSRKNSRIAGIIGTGAQARLQLEALTLIRPIETVYVYGRSTEKAEVYKEDIERSLGLHVVICEHPEAVAEFSDILVTTTPAVSPLVKGKWLKPGVHITAMGSDAEHKKELDNSVLERADVIFCDVLDQSLRLGELRGAENHILEKTMELGQVITNQQQGRTHESQITLCDLTGTGIQDTAIARHVYPLLLSKEELKNERS
ncbi:cyclodeaminase [Halobacillus yeomjeoni]|uniref:Cyclodeaminase n=1 Tax=Halobacillus yeomjeoni TaxID=311194 RepID=A0A931HVQ3_9BACI|nr:cyclodeaminase [Halobacillus yeomjeoni]MBH0230365.1 cyclodeaminase [Halobacillus yeomjeoni]